MDLKKTWLGKAVLGIVGPTASGKSSLALALAKRFDAEIVSVDSVQIYRGLDIGSGKLMSWQQEGIPHHLLDIVDPSEDFDAGQFQQAADAAIRQIQGRGKNVLLVGGTGLYLRALLRGLIEIPSEPAVREALRQRVVTDGLPLLYQELLQVDPVAAAKIAPQDPIRIVRALEVFTLTGRPFSSWASEHQHSEERYPALLLGLAPPMDLLTTRLRDRIDGMFKDGWTTEVHHLRLQGFGPHLRPMQCIGYREISAFLDGRLDPALLPEEIKKQTRAYARRQMTWFRKESVLWFQEPSAVLSDPSLLARLEAFLGAT